MESTAPNLQSHYALFSAFFHVQFLTELNLDNWVVSISSLLLYYFTEEKNLLELKKLHFSAQFLFLEVMGFMMFEGTCIHQDFDFIFKR